MNFDDDFMDEEEREEKNRVLNDKRELELLTIRNTMSNESGRAFMWRCLQNCCTFESIYNESAARSNFNSGLRSHGLWLDQELRTATKDNYYLMLKENR